MRSGPHLELLLDHLAHPQPGAHLDALHERDDDRVGRDDVAHDAQVLAQRLARHRQVDLAGALEHLRQLARRRDAARQVDAGQVVGVAPRLHDLACQLGPARPDRDPRAAVGEDLRERGAPRPRAEHGDLARFAGQVGDRIIHPAILAYRSAVAAPVPLAWPHGTPRSDLATPRTTLQAAGQTTTRAAGVVSEFFSGFATLFRGFTLVEAAPRPHAARPRAAALIVAAGLIALILVIAANAEGIVGFVTPFADSWDPGWARLFRVVAALALLIGFVVLAAFGFTGADPADRRLVLRAHLVGGRDRARRHAREARDGILALGGRFVPARGARRAHLAAAGAAQLHPAWSAPCSASVLGFVFTARILALELTTRPLEARGSDPGRAARRPAYPVAARARVRRRRCSCASWCRAARSLVMPAAVAGATHLARHLIDGTEGVQS